MSSILMYLCGFKTSLIRGADSHVECLQALNIEMVGEEAFVTIGARTGHDIIGGTVGGSQTYFVEHGSALVVASGPGYIELNDELKYKQFVLDETQFHFVLLRITHFFCQ